MGGGDHVGSGGVDLGVDGEGCGIERPGALDDGALVVDQQEILDPDLAEAHAERVHPEVVRQLGVARGDVPGRPLTEPEPTEQAEGGGQALLAVPTLLLDGAELRKGVREPIGWHETSVRAFVPVSP